MPDEKDRGPIIPHSTDEESTNIDKTSAEPARKTRIEEPGKDRSKEEPNPARTTRGAFTAPKFGSAGSGGAEFEPGPEKD